MSSGGIINLLRRLYPRARTALTHSDPFELLIATILSAQCTDERVNKVTPALFAKYKGPRDFAAASQSEIERAIHSTGFYRNKAKSIISSSKTLIEKFGGKVPKTMDELLTLRGVARKTANVVLGSGYGIISGVVVDTHVKRLAFRMGLTKQTNPEKVELDLMRAVPKKDWIWLSHALIAHGRKTCKAISPHCADCPLSKLCPRKGLSG